MDNTPVLGVEPPMGVFPHIPSGREQKLAPGEMYLNWQLWPKNGSSKFQFFVQGTEPWAQTPLSHNCGSAMALPQLFCVFVFRRGDASPP